MAPWHDATLAAADIWRASAHPIALTGAGISVASGIPDFRSPGGLWERYNPTQVASLESLVLYPDKVWEFLLDAALVFGSARPNAAHTALAELERAGRLEAIITQNIDNLHQEAGSVNVVEFHGNAMRYYCKDCKKDGDPALVPTLTRADIPWRCEHCGGVMRPDFVFFGEHIPPRALVATNLHTAKADLCVIVGTSGEVAPANAIPHQVRRAGGKVIELNLGRTCYGDMADVRIDAPCEEALPLLRDLVLQKA